ncbi:MAG: response regulator [Lachnospiraceae bacterium]|nr:response regulator [Lachnospiraceae bacterium]
MSKKDTEEFEQEKTLGNAISGKRNKLIISLVFMVLFFTLILSIVISTRAIASGGKNNMKSEVNGYIYELDTWISEQKGLMDISVNNIHSNSSMLENYDETVKWLDEIDELNEDVASAYIVLPDEAHSLIVSGGWQPDDNFNVEERHWYIDTIDEDNESGFNISAPYLDAYTGEYCFTFSERIYNSQGEYLGIFCIDFYLDRITRIINNTDKAEGYVFLIDNEGYIIRHPNKQYTFSDIGKKSVDEVNEYEDVLKSTRPIKINDYDGKKKVAYAALDETSGFYIVSVKNWNFIYGNAVKYDILFLVLFGFCIVIILYLIYRLIRWSNRANKILQESVEDAVRAGEAKTEFLAHMSHEIRTPINAVLGMDEMILRDSNEEVIKGYADDIRSAGNSLLLIVNDILDMSKIESGKLTIVPVKYDTSSMFYDLINMIRFRADAKRLEFVVEIDEKIPSVLRGDEVRVKQVITNILTNAVKYTHEGIIWLRVRGNQNYNTEKLYVEVEDTGIGIKEEDLSKLFSAFERIDEKHNRNIEGTGLGMHITQRLLKLMGSSLHVESEYGKGSKFYFEIEQEIVDKKPIGKFEERVNGSIKEYEFKQLFYAPNARVLVVDDNELNLKVFVSLLKHTGVKITTASSGQECLDLTAANYYDIIFLDHMMPEMDGIETLHLMKENLQGPNKRTPVYVLTANAVTGAKEMYMSEGFTGFLSKPIDADRLERVIVDNLAKNLLEPIPEDHVHKADAQSEGNGDIAEKGVISMEDFPMIGGIDWKYAMSHLNSEELVITTTKEFLSLLPSNLKKLDTAYDQVCDGGVCDDYRIQVHSMKSVAATLGIIPVAGMANVLEYAARDEKIDDIKAMHPVFKRVYTEYGNQLSEAFSNEEEGILEIDNADEVKEKLKLLKESMEDLDIDTADAIIEELIKFKYTPEQESVMKELEAAVTSLESEEVARLADNLIESL